MRVLRWLSEIILEFIVFWLNLLLKFLNKIGKAPRVIKKLDK
jgi:hypothetical protein